MPRLVVKKNIGKLEGQLMENSWWLRREEIHEKKQEPGSLECISESLTVEGLQVHERVPFAGFAGRCCDNGNWYIWCILGPPGPLTTTIAAMPCGIPRGRSSHPTQGLEFQRRISL